MAIARSMMADGEVRVSQSDWTLRTLIDDLAARGDAASLGTVEGENLSALS